MGEIPEPTDRGLTPEQEASVEDLADKRGISMDMARRAILGERIEPTGPIAAPKEPTKPHRIGHVRDFESDRDHEDAALRAAYVELTPEERAAQQQINSEGRAKVDIALDEAFGKDRHIKAIEAKVEAMIPIDPDRVQESLKARERMTNALLRKHFDGKTTA
jgi:hypothetical protein